MGQTWLSPQTDIELLLMTCEMVDERWNLRIKVLQDNRPEERKGLRDLERQLIGNLSLLDLLHQTELQYGTCCQLQRLHYPLLYLLY